MKVIKINKAIKQTVSSILPEFIRDMIHPPSAEYKWTKLTKRLLSGKIRKEINISTDGEIYLKSDLGFDFLLNENEKRLKIDTFDNLDFSQLVKHLSFRLPEDCICLDIGAFYGGYSLAMAKVFPGSKIYSFEPVSASFMNLKKNIVRNGLENVIFPFQFAISNIPGEILITTNYSTGNHILSMNEKKTFIEKVPSISLDSFLKQMNLKQVHFIKCDVEGYEMAVLDGAFNILTKYRPIMFIEIAGEWTKRYNNSPQEIISRLTSLGYKGYSFKQNSLMEIIDFESALLEMENFIFMSIY